MPSYEASFRSFSTRVVLPGPLTDEAAPDARMVVDALESGRSFTAIDANAAPAWLEFAGERAGAVAVMGEPAKGDGPTTVRARVPGTDGLSLVLLRNGVAVHSQSGSSLSTTVTEAGELPRRGQVDRARERRSLDPEQPDLRRSADAGCDDAGGPRVDGGAASPRG